MRSAVLFIALILSAPALAQFDAQHAPPDWMVQGYEAAIADPTSIRAAVERGAFWGLAEFVPSARADPVIDKLLPLLDDEDGYVRDAAAEALGQITPGERAGVVVDKLLPFLGDPASDMRYTAAEVLGRIATGERAFVVIDKLLPLLGDRVRRQVAVEALSRIATEEGAGVVIDKLLPLLGDKDRIMRAYSTASSRSPCDSGHASYGA
jgi:hypothetical protein